jgi:hypothetical protein
MIQSAVGSWKTTIGRLNTLFDRLSEADFHQQIAPDRNRVIYLLGHLTAVHDLTLEVLGFGKRDHAELDDRFIKHPDRSLELNNSVSDLMSFWQTVNLRLDDGMQSLSPEQWVGRHQSVSEDDFAKDPTRNRLSVVLNRTGHANYHLGQLMLWRSHKE